MLAAVVAHAGVHVADAEGGEGGQQGEEEGELGFHGGILSLKRDERGWFSISRIRGHIRPVLAERGYVRCGLGH